MVDFGDGDLEVAPKGPPAREKPDPIHSWSSSREPMPTLLSVGSLIRLDDPMRHCRWGLAAHYRPGADALVPVQAPSALSRHARYEPRF